MVEPASGEMTTGKRGSSDEFFVGYLPVPSRLARFLRIIVPVALVAAAVIGWIVTRAHNRPGTGEWIDDRVQSFEGVIDTTPCAMLRVAAGDGEGVQTILLVSEGKFGARERAAAFAGRMVRVRGTVLQRDGRRMLELVDGESAIEAVDGGASGALRQPAAEALGERTLRGEIIDPKCYLGAMKPGEGKAHKDCATLCISGGIPPMFITRGEEGGIQYYLLAGVDGRSVDDRILPFVADPVEIRGSVDRLGDLLVFRIDPAAIRRL
jgi:hypothetical protein